MNGVFRLTGIALASLMTGGNVVSAQGRGGGGNWPLGRQRPAADFVGQSRREDFERQSAETGLPASLEGEDGQPAAAAGTR